MVTSSMKRKMPSSKNIKEYWVNTLITKYDKFDFGYEVLEMNSCFACGVECNKLARCHITPKSLGGSDKVENLHLLCPMCHKNSENLMGEDYESWFIKRNMFNMSLSCLMYYSDKTIFSKNLLTKVHNLFDNPHTVGDGWKLCLWHLTTVPEYQVWS